MLNIILETITVVDAPDICCRLFGARLMILRTLLETRNRKAYINTCDVLSGNISDNAPTKQKKINSSRKKYKPNSRAKISLVNLFINVCFLCCVEKGRVGAKK